MAVFLSADDEQRAFIRHCYQHYLGRPPESNAAMEAWLGELRSKGGDPVLAFFFGCDEAIAYRARLAG